MLTSITFTILLSCNKYKGDLLVINAYYSKNPLCPSYVYYESEKLTIENIRRYKNGKLVEYQGCGSEGLYTDNFDGRGKYSKEDEALKQLSISKKGNKIFFFSKEYEAVKESNDTIFVKSKVDDEYLVFVGTIPEN
ncbi:hypothetical protein [Chryseobacterium aureum]|uniref:hypothetical protein n=1 Tax=Chryseobacterium aureum TaxID=2497456 RepID=UPI000F88FA44|nr:hypothetical protein [Chryseobacterium aureum]